MLGGEGKARSCRNYHSKNCDIFYRMRRNHYVSFFVRFYMYIYILLLAIFLGPQTYKNEQLSIKGGGCVWKMGSGDRTPIFVGLLADSGPYKCRAWHVNITKDVYPFFPLLPRTFLPFQQDENRVFVEEINTNQDGTDLGKGAVLDWISWRYFLLDGDLSFHIYISFFFFFFFF